MWRQAAALCVVLVASVTMSATAAQAAHPAKKQPNAIVVHGRWVITVRNKRGKVVERRRFENHLTEGGSDLLVQLLSDASHFPSVADWKIGLWEQTGDGPFTTLEATVTPKNVYSTTGGSPALVLTGSASSSETSSWSSEADFVFVQTILDGHDFTDQQIASTPVQPGQAISVTVTITFAYS